MFNIGSRMLDLKLLKSSPEEFEKKLQTKDPSVSLAPLLDNYDKLLKAKSSLEALQAKHKTHAKMVGELKRKNEDTSSLFEEMTVLKEQEQTLKKSIQELETAVRDAASILPNLPSDEAKVSLDPKDNVSIKTHGTKPTFNFTPKHHLQLNEQLKIFDFPRGSKMTGSGWPVYMGKGAELEWALLNYMLSIHQKNGFTFCLVPHLVKPDVLYGVGQLPKFKEQLFKLDDADHPYYLIPTAEAPLTGLHLDEVIPEKELPLQYVSYTPCFRREAGAAGSSERGLIRVHQFNKVEMYCIALPEQSEAIFQQMLSSAEEVLQGLGLHYKNMMLVTGDMSFAAAKTIDIEVFLPGQNRYYEVSSVSHCTDFQARRSKIRTKQDKKTTLLHTLNGSGLATARLMVALLENNQQEDGSVTIPTVLQPFMNGLSVLSHV